MRCVLLTVWILLGAFYLLCQPLPIKLGDNRSPLYLLPVPVIFYEPYTNVGFGGIVGASFRIKDSSSRFSSARLYVAYTLKNQFLSSLRHYLYTLQQSYLLKGAVYFRKFVEDVYERGEDSRETSARTVAYNLLGVEQHLLKNIKLSNWFVGLTCLYENYSDIRDITESDAISFLSTEIFPTSAMRIGIGLSVIYDSRDNVNSTHKGTYVSFTARRDIRELGASQEVLDILVDVRLFRLLKKGVGTSPVVAFRLYSHLAVEKAVPYLFLSKIGERYTSRGIKEGRYRSEWFSSLEAAYRFSLFPCSTNWFFRGLKVNLFATVNVLNNQPNAFTSLAFMPTIGFGLRYEISRKSRQMLRGDLALGSRHNRGLYVNLNEAF